MAEETLEQASKRADRAEKKAASAERRAHKFEVTIARLRQLEGVGFLPAAAWVIRDAPHTRVLDGIHRDAIRAAIDELRKDLDEQIRLHRFEDDSDAVALARYLIGRLHRKAAILAVPPQPDEILAAQKTAVLAELHRIANTIDEDSSVPGEFWRPPSNAIMEYIERVEKNGVGGGSL